MVMFVGLTAHIKASHAVKDFKFYLGKLIKFSRYGVM